MQSPPPTKSQPNCKDVYDTSFSLTLFLISAMSPFVFMAAILFFAGLIQGTIGFGFGMISMSLLVRFVDIQQAVVLVAFFSLLVHSCWRSPFERRCDLRVGMWRRLHDRPFNWPSQQVCHWYLLRGASQLPVCLPLAAWLSSLSTIGRVALTSAYHWPRGSHLCLLTGRVAFTSSCAAPNQLVKLTGLYLLRRSHC